MSDQQAQELTPEEEDRAVEIVRLIAAECEDAIAGERHSVKAGNAFRIARLLAARSAGQVERPDDGKIQMYNLGGEYPDLPTRLLAWPDLCKAQEAAREEGERIAAARLPERPDEGPPHWIAYQQDGLNHGQAPVIIWSDTEAASYADREDWQVDGPYVSAAARLPERPDEGQRAALLRILDEQDTEWATDPASMDQRFVANQYAGKLERIFAVARAAVASRPPDEETERTIRDAARAYASHLRSYAIEHHTLTGMGTAARIDAALAARSPAADKEITEAMIEAAADAIQDADGYVNRLSADLYARAALAARPSVTEEKP